MCNVLYMRGHARYVAVATRIHIISSLSEGKTYRFYESKNIEQSKIAYRQNKVYFFLSPNFIKEIYNMRKSAKVISLILAFILVFCACSRNTDSVSKDGPSNDHKNGGIIKMGCVPIDTLNPLITNHSSIADFLSLVYEGLFVAMPDLSAKPVLASEYVASKDNTVYTIKLKGGVRFHNGKNFSSEDVIATLSYISMYGGKYSSVAESISSFTAPSEDTVIITLKKPIADFVNSLDFPILPSGLGYGDFTSPSSAFIPVGTGMYVYDSTIEYKNIYLKANNLWHNEKKRPHIDKVDIEILSDEETVISAFDAGAIDILATSWKNPAELNLTSDLYNSFITQQNRLTFIGLNDSVAAFDTKDERNAFVSVINRDKLCGDIMLGHAVATTFPIREKIYFNEETSETNNDKENLSLKEDLKTIEKPSQIVLLYNSDSKTKKRLALNLKQQLDIAGYNTVLNAQPFDAYLSKVSNCEYDLYIGEVSIDNSSNLEFMFGEERSSQNICSYSAPELATLVSNLNRMSGKENKLVALENLKKYYLDNAFQVSLYFTNGEAYVTKRISGTLSPNLSNLYYGFENLYFEK